jgi:long-chain acyl-CoA synthetase
LKEHPDVQDAMVTGVRSKAWGEVVVAYVAPKDGKISEKDLDTFCRSHHMLARYQRPRFYKFVSFAELPFNESGKKLHHVIKARAKEDFPNVE